MLKIRRRTLVQRVVNAGADQVVAWVALPTGGELRKLSVKLHLVLGSSISVVQAKGFGFSGYVFPLNNPSAVPSGPDAVWDMMVPKDAALSTDSLDMDPTAGDTEPEQDYAKFSAETMFDLTTHGVVQLFKGEDEITFANSPRGFVDASTDEYRPTKFMQFHVNKRVRVKQPSVVLLGISSGDNPVATSWSGSTNAWSPNTDAEWQQLKYLEDSLLFAMPWLSGETTGSATNVFQHRAEMAGRMVDQTYESTDGTFDVTTALSVIAVVTYWIAVPGTQRLGTLKEV